MFAIVGEESRFGVRDAVPADAEGIARAHAESWASSYRGILPESELALDVAKLARRAEARVRDRAQLQLVAYDRTHGDIVGFCDAGPSRRDRSIGGEIYAIYIVDRAKRYGVGREMIERVKGWLAASGKRSLVIWVLENNHHARRFYTAMGGRAGTRIQSSVGGFPVVEVAYVWDSLSAA
jgi:GNAT superfamily N-acetyltransferase